MFDARLRPLIDPLLNRLGRALARAGVSATMLTVIGGVCGVAAGAAIALDQIGAALALILLSRLFDGLDGAVARATQPTDFGGFLDFVADFFFYVAVPVGFGLRDNTDAVPAMTLLGAFALTGVSFLAFAAIAARRGVETTAHGVKSFFYSTGIAEGAETILVFVLFCLFPQWFAPIAFAFAALCLLTVFQRVALAASTFRD